jgi:hypothetical protein
MNDPNGMFYHMVTPSFISIIQIQNVWGPMHWDIKVQILFRGQRNPLLFIQMKAIFFRKCWLLLKHFRFWSLKPPMV